MNPPNMPADDLFAKITAIPRPSSIVDFPRINPVTKEPACQIGIVILSAAEISSAESAAEKYTKEVMKTPVLKDEQSKAYEDIYTMERCVQLLLRAVRNPENINQPFFSKASQIRDNLTGDEIGILLNHYITIQGTLGPIISNLTEEEMEDWIKKLAEGGSSSKHFLDLFSLDALKDLLIIMASQLVSYKTDTSLPNLQPTESRTE